MKWKLSQHLKNNNKKTPHAEEFLVKKKKMKEFLSS